MEVVHKLFKFKFHSIRSTKIFLNSEMQEAARELIACVLQVPATLLHLTQAALMLIFVTVRTANKFEAFLRTLVWIHHSPAQVGTAGPGQHKTLGQRKLPLKNLHTSGKWFSKQLFHKALWKTLFQSHYSALEGVSSGRRNSSWSPGHSWLPVKETHRWAVAIPSHQPHTSATLLQIGVSS